MQIQIIKEKPLIEKNFLEMNFNIPIFDYTTMQIKQSSTLNFVKSYDLQVAVLVLNFFINIVIITEVMNLFLFVLF